MALAHPDSPELKRFSFFVSRRREDNRERFRLHMGYFTTLAEAEEWLNVIRDMYPGAWAGEAPGKKLRARAAAAALANQLPRRRRAPRAVRTLAHRRECPARASARGRAAAPVEIARADAAIRADESVRPAPQRGLRPLRRRCCEAVARRPLRSRGADGCRRRSAGPSPARSPRRRIRRAAPVIRPRSQPRARQPAPPRRLRSRRSAARTARPAAPSFSRSPSALQSPRRRSAQPVACRARRAAVRHALTDGSNVREVMASLDETGETRQMQIPPGLRALAPAAARPAAACASSSGAVPHARQWPDARDAPPERPDAPRTSRRSGEPATGAHVAEQRPLRKPRAAAPPARVAALDDPMSDTQVLSILEQRRDDDAERQTTTPNAGISLLKPDDTQTRRALKEAVQRERAGLVRRAAAVVGAAGASSTRFRRSPSSAPTRCTRWKAAAKAASGTGCGSGFFSDAISAKQVAYYVRSEFTSVAVVPVSPAGEARASDEETKAATGRVPEEARAEQKVEEFKLFDDAKSVVDRTAAAAAEALPKPPKPAPPRPAHAGPQEQAARPRAARRSSAPQDARRDAGDSRRERAGDRQRPRRDAQRHRGAALRVEVQKNTPFAKLLDRFRSAFARIALRRVASD